MNKSIKLGLAIAMLALAALPAAHAAEGKIAVFDAQQVINGTNAANRAISALTGKRDAAQTRINALEKPLLEKQKKLREQQAVMAPDKFNAEKEAFAKDLLAFRNQAQQIQTDLDEENLKLRKTIADAVRTVVEQIAKEKGYDIILPKGLTFYSSANVPDISADALARANKLLDK
jgi:Skp family chaperone for outer membrane proteins